MKIGLISDIHSRIAALDRALELLDRLRVDTILCAGDTVEEGQPDSDKVISRLRTLNIPCVRGNHDGWTIQQQVDLRAALTTSELRLPDADLAWLEALPPDYRAIYEGQHLYMTHGVPGSQEDPLFYRYPDSTKQIVAGVGADIIVTGHTHMALYMQVGGVHCLNPGTVWSAFHENFATCAVLSLPEFRFEVYDLFREQRISVVALLD